MRDTQCVDQLAVVAVTYSMLHHLLENIPGCMADKGLDADTFDKPDGIVHVFDAHASRELNRILMLVFSHIPGMTHNMRAAGSAGRESFGRRSKVDTGGCQGRARVFLLVLEAAGR